MEQKTILITGASRGIGKSIALRFASRGYHTFLNCSSSVDELKKAPRLYHAKNTTHTLHRSLSGMSAILTM